jgi:diadenosine tetraphosphate (Ap4A) HIT family hydrolase
VVEHCVGPLGVGTLIVKPIRHVTHLADLDAGEVAQLGTLLYQASTAVTELADPDQVYVCLWSHADRRPGHIHFVVQPVSAGDMRRFNAHGPAQQVAMFTSAEPPPVSQIEAFSTRAAAWFMGQST